MAEINPTLALSADREANILVLFALPQCQQATLASACFAHPRGCIQSVTCYVGQLRDLRIVALLLYTAAHWLPDE